MWGAEVRRLARALLAQDDAMRRAESMIHTSIIEVDHIEVFRQRMTEICGSLRAALLKRD